MRFTYEWTKKRQERMIDATERVAYVQPLYVRIVKYIMIINIIYCFKCIIRRRIDLNDLLSEI